MAVIWLFDLVHFPHSSCAGDSVLRQSRNKGGIGLASHPGTRLRTRFANSSMEDIPATGNHEFMSSIYLHGNIL